MTNLFGYEVNEPSKILITTSHEVEYIESNIQNIETSRKNDPYHLVRMRKHTYKVQLKEFLKLFKCLADGTI